MKDKATLYKRIYTKLPVLLFIFSIVVMPEAALGYDFRNSAFNISIQDDFDKIFREGRDLIDKEEWANAAEKFAKITNKYPQNRSTDAALYWLAFCYKKQGKMKESGVAVNRLIKGFPNSTWVSDAKVLLLEVGSQNRNAPGKTPPENISRSLDEYNESLAEYQQSLEEYAKTMSAEMPLDGIPIEREDEIRLATFQKLLAADTRRAIEIAGQVLQKDSKTSEILKRQIVRAFHNSRFVKIQTAGSFEYVRATTPINKELIPLLRETLKRGFENESNKQVRTEIIYTLADIDDAESINYLVRTYASTTDKDIKKTIIYSLGSPTFSLSGTFKGIKISAVPSETAKEQNIHFEKLLEIIRTEKDINLRRAAFSTLQKFIDLSPKDGAIKAVFRIYDTETDERFKVPIINYLSKLKNDQSIAKLMDIAKNDKNKDLRFMAIYALRPSKDPKVIKFLESLLK